MTAAPDRSRPPEPGPPPDLVPPPVAEGRLASGVAVAATPYGGVPITRASIAVPAGRLREPREKAGLAALLAAALEEGTRRLDGTALQDELDSLGAGLEMGWGDDELEVSLCAPNRHLPRALALLEEVLLEPRLDPAEVERRRRQRAAELAMRSDHAAAVASDTWGAVLFGAERTAGAPPAGTPESVERVAVEDLARFLEAARRPGAMRLGVVGAVAPEEAGERLPRLASLAEPAAAVPPADDAPAALPAGPSLTLVDLPGAPQSEIRVGHPAAAMAHPDFFPLQAANHPLGGSFSSRLNLELRERRGWTYGVRSSFQGGLALGTFTVAAAVHTEVTADAVRAIRDILARFREGVTDEEVDFTRRSLVQTMALRYEATAARLALVRNVSKYGWPADYPARRVAWLRAMERRDLDDLLARHLFPDRAAVLVVGDAERVRRPLEELGLGQAELRGRDGARVG